MNSRKKQLKNSRLYLILDKDVCEEKRLIRVLAAALAGGVDIVQYRDKSSSTKGMMVLAKILASRTHAAGRLFIVNDKIDVALASGADGVHLGQEDTPVPLARRLLKRDMIIGLSCHSLKDVRRSLHMSADYLGFGPVFATKTKPRVRPRGMNLLRQAAISTRRPIFAIGGIQYANLDTVLKAASRIAVCRDICLAHNVTDAARRLKLMLAKSERTTHFHV